MQLRPQAQAPYSHPEILLGGTRSEQKVIMNANFDDLSTLEKSKTRLLHCLYLDVPFELHDMWINHRFLTVKLTFTTPCVHGKVPWMTLPIPLRSGRPSGDLVEFSTRCAGLFRNHEAMLREDASMNLDFVRRSVIREGYITGDYAIPLFVTLVVDCHDRSRYMVRAQRPSDYLGCTVLKYGATLQAHSGNIVNIQHTHTMLCTSL